MTAVGTDPLGDQLVASTEAAGVGVDHVARVGAPTGSYTAVLDHDGELLVAIASMAAIDELGAPEVEKAAGLIAGACLLVLDGNLDTAALEAARAVAGDVPLVLDPVSVPKAERVRGLLDGTHPWHLVTPDYLELAALTGRPATYERQVVDACRHLHDRGVTWVWVREGERGSLLSGPDGTTHLPALPTRVVDVTGAGDAMLAAWCHGVLTGRTPLDAARLGHAAAAVTIASDAHRAPGPDPRPARAGAERRARMTPHPSLLLTDEVGRRAPGRRTGGGTREHDHQPRACPTRATSRWPVRSKASSGTPTWCRRRSRSCTDGPGSGSPTTTSSCSPAAATSTR